MTKSVDENNNKTDNDKKHTIPLHKAYIWGIVICISALLSLMMYHELRDDNRQQEMTGDFLSQLRDNHEHALKRQRLKVDHGDQIGNLEDQLFEETGIRIVFPNWFSNVPDINIVGTKVETLDNSRIVFLVFSEENDDSRLINFLTIYDKRDEIEQFDTMILGEEEHQFYTYNWRRNNAYFWNIDEDNQQITYGLISNINPEDLQMYALEIMRSIKMLYKR